MKVPAYVLTNCGDSERGLFIYKGDAMKLVINVCYGGFSLSPEAILWMYKHGAKELATPVKKYFGGDNDAYAKAHPDHNWKAEYQKSLAEWKKYQQSKGKDSLFVTVFSPDEKYVLDSRPQDRANPLLIECVKRLGKKASARLAELKIVEIPDGVQYEIDEYDGLETIHEQHRSWQ